MLYMVMTDKKVLLSKPLWHTHNIKFEQEYRVSQKYDLWHKSVQYVMGVLKSGLWANWVPLWLYLSWIKETWRVLNYNS